MKYIIISVMLLTLSGVIFPLMDMALGLEGDLFCEACKLLISQLA